MFNISNHVSFGTNLSQGLKKRLEETKLSDPQNELVSLIEDDGKEGVLEYTTKEVKGESGGLIGTAGVLSLNTGDKSLLVSLRFEPVESGKSKKSRETNLFNEIIDPFSFRREVQDAYKNPAFAEDNYKTVIDSLG